MSDVTIVGSGASGVHFALSVLQKGYQVLMLDVGSRKAPPVNPGDGFRALKSTLTDPVEYLLGGKFEAVLFPHEKSEYYGFPPSKQYVFVQPPQFRQRSEGFAPLVSFAQGGLAEAWTGGCYPMSAAELVDFPFSHADLRRAYDEVSRRIGINGALDDLARFFPDHDALLEPLDLDEHSQALVSRYARRKPYLNRSLGCYLGRSRLATLSRGKDSRQACSYLGRCLWGCPVDALYTPLATLNECLRHPNFTYVPGTYVQRFRYSPSRRITHVVAVSINSGEEHEFEVDTLVLAAGTLSTTRILLESVRHGTGQTVKLRGLMDNRQVLVPFVNLGMVGKAYNPDRYQYHQLSLGLEAEDPKHYVHAQITTLKTALIHPIVQSVPFDMKSSLSVFRNVHAALGLVNVNLCDTRREENYVTLDGAAGGDLQSACSRLVLRYAPAPGERGVLKRAVRRVKRALWALRCVVPPGMVHVRPMGASVHYAGTLPMSKDARPWTSSPDCRSHDFENLYCVDGTTFPFLPAKNLTFTLMANAVRVAECAF